jgi:hypothetical protein
VRFEAEAEAEVAAQAQGVAQRLTDVVARNFAL